MEDEDEGENENGELLKIVDLLIQVRSRKIDRLNRVYRQSVLDHQQSISEWQEARNSFTDSVAEGKEKKDSMQVDMMAGSTGISEISSWLNKEKEIDKHVEGKKTSMKEAKNIEGIKLQDTKERKKDYLAAEKRLEKMKLFKEELNVS